MLRIYENCRPLVLVGLALCSAMTIVSCVTRSTGRGSTVNACIANMKHVEPAKSTWDLEHGNTNVAKPAWALEQRKRASAAEQPDWTALHQLLGKPITAKPVVDFVKTHELRKAAKGTSGSFTAPQQAYSVMFDWDRVQTIVIKVSPWPEGYGEADWTSYDKPLPVGLAPGDGRKAVERKLGSPTDAGGDQWRHRELTIWVFFNQQESAINELYVWRTKDKR